MPAERELEALAASVSDGVDVDWSVATQGARGSDGQPAILALREVARIVEFNRGLQRVPLPDGGATHGALEPGRWGHLILLEPIAAGARGQIWRAWEPQLRREVALKFLKPADPGTSASLLEEARALARVRHVGVVAIHGIAEHEGRAGIWMELLRGPSLAAELERRGGLPATEVHRIALELGRALAALEAAGVVHGDVKPANVVLEPDGRVVLTDFGLGRRPALDEPANRRAAGTPVFMAPELLAGGEATPQSDLYALGATLRWALTGHAPFTARTLEELRGQAAAGPSTALAQECPAAPAKLVTAIERAMAPAPAARPAGAVELVRLVEAGAAAPAITRPDAPAPAGATRARPIAPRPLVLLAPLAATALLLLWIFRPHDAAPPPRSSAPAVSEPLTAGAPAPSPAPAAAAGYEIEAALFARAGGAARRLGPGDRVAPGDRLSLELHATRPLWIYVLNEDERGETYLLFPQPLFDQGNPVAADSTVMLPGTIGGRENAWEVTSRGGREHFLIVASPEPVADIEAELQRLPEARPGRPIRYARVEPQTLERLRGVGGVVALPPDRGPRRAGAFAHFQALASRETVPRGVWVRTITLENPLR